ALEAARLRVAEEGSVQIVRAALGDDVHDAAGRLAELRLVAAGLDLDLLDEVERRRVAERPEDDRIRPERAVALVGDVHAVDDVLVVEAGAAGDRRIRTAGRTGAADTRRQVQRVADPAAHRNVLEHLARQHSAGGRRRGVDDRRARGNLNGFSEAADVHLHGHFNGLPEADRDVVLLERLEAFQRRTDGIGTRREERDRETSLGVGHRVLRALRAGDGHGGAWHRQALRI